MKHRTCVREVHFSAGHRVSGHESVCANLHGHNYEAWIHCCPIDDLDALGRVIDFGVVKAKVGAWIDSHWDHGFVLWTHDSAGRAAMQAFEASSGLTQKVFWLDRNPTAENMAAALLEVARSILSGYGIVVEKVVLFETPRCYAEVS